MSNFRNAVLYAATALNCEMAIGRYGAASSVQRKLFRTLQIFSLITFFRYDSVSFVLWVFKQFILMPYFGLLSM